MITEEEWQTIVPGKTVFVNKDGNLFNYIGMHTVEFEERVVVWIQKKSGYESFSVRFVLAAWSIEYTWKNVTKECVINDKGRIVHNGFIMWEHNPLFKNYKFGPDLQIWERQI